MMNDAALVHAVLGWTVGLTGLLAAGIAAPAVACFLPDALRLARAVGHPTPVLADLGMVLGLLLMGGVAIHAASVGGPGAAAWLVLCVPALIATSAIGGTAAARRATRLARGNDALRAELDRTAPVAR